MIMATCLVLCLSVFVWLGARAGASHIGLGSRLLARDQNEAWVSDNGTFAFGLTPAANAGDQFQVAIWFADLPGDRTIVWSANSDNLIYRNSLVNKNAFLELDTTGNLVLIDGERTVWMSNTSGAGITSASMEETGNFILHTNNNHSAWQSFEHPSDTLLPNQPLTVSLELTSPKSTSQGGYYSLKMLQQPTSLSLALTYNLPETYDASPEAYANFSYWPGPDISNVTGDVVAVLDDAGSFGIVYGESSNGAVYVYKNDGDYNGLESATNQSSTRLAVSKCGDACLSDCECVASVYGLDGEKPYCWILRSLDFGGYEDTGSTLFVKVRGNESMAPAGYKSGKDEEDDTRKKVVIIPLVLGMTILAGLLCLLLYYNVHKKRYLKRSMESSHILPGAPIHFTYRDLLIRTCNFSELLGTGGFGSVYKGSLGDGTLVAVKKLDKVLPHGEKEFITEVNTIGSMHHMNLVRLCGYCSEGSQRLLVYEFLKNGSLDKWIFPSYSCRDRLLDWSTRFDIAIATAQGIAYFHEQCRDRIIHCDIKPENILLDENFCPKVSDFGLAKLMGREHSHVVTMVRGTRGYLAPEWVSNRPITVKADVYSYGMLLLEIVGGRRNLDMSFDAEDFFYPGWAFKAMMNDTPLKAADRRLEGSVKEEELIRAVKVAFWCIQDEVFSRPSMGEVVKMLEGSMDINTPPMPQTVLELIEEGLEQVYKAMKRDFNQYSSFTAATGHPSSQATCSYSTMSPR